MNIKTLLGSAWNNSFYRFLMVGAVNTVFGYLLYAALLFLGLHYAFAAACATVGGVLFNYMTTGRIVFRHRGENRLPGFVAVYVLLYFINVAALWGFDTFQVDLYLAGAVLILPLAILGFLLNRYLVFK